MTYVAQLISEGDFALSARDFFLCQGQGLNVTVPFKLDAFKFADRHTNRAQRAAAVNTLMLCEDGMILGDNTDGVGLINDITVNLGWPIDGRRILLLGAGGAVRGILEPLLRQRPHLVVIANRTAEKASNLAIEFEDLGPVIGGGFSALAERQFDLIINGTAASLQGNLPPLPPSIIADTCFCYDMMYGSTTTVFNRWASTAGATATADGLGMLVEQAAEAFFLWRSIRPNTADVITALRIQLAATAAQDSGDSGNAAATEKKDN